MVVENTKKMIEKIMDYHALDRLRFAQKYGLQASQVTRWLNDEQVPKTETYLLIKEEYDKIKDKDPPQMRMII